MTKPIELGVKKTDLPKKTDLLMQAKIEKLEPTKGRKQAATAADERSEAATMALAPPRARKISAKPEIIDRIGEHLGDIYNGVLKQPVPARFLDLLQALEAGTPAKPHCEAQTPSKSDTHITPKARTAGGRKKDLK